MSSTQNILEFEIVVNVRASEETKQTIKQLEEAKKTTQQVRTSTKQSKKQLTTPEFFKSPLAHFTSEEFEGEEIQKIAKEEMAIKKETLEFLKKLDSQGLQTLSNFATNPTGATLNSLTRILTMAGADAAMFLSVIGIAITAPIVIEQLIKALSIKGGPLNRDWKRYLDQEVDVGLSRQQVKQREQGIDVVVLTERSGFVPNNSNWTYNSLFDIDDKRISRIGLADRAAGVYSS